jgi:hypothetical protein
VTSATALARAPCGILGSRGTSATRCVDRLALIRRAAKLRERRRAAADDADAELRRLICEGFEQHIPGEKLAEAAGLSVPRVYQIRDKRR